LKINGNQTTPVKPTGEELQLAGDRPFVYGHALNSIRDKQGQNKLVVSPAFKPHAQTTQPRCPVKEKTPYHGCSVSIFLLISLPVNVG